MKHLIFSAGICSLAFANNAQAQDMSPKEPATAPKLTLGLQAGLSRENQHSLHSTNYYSDNSLSIIHPALGMFARYRLGEHLAIQGGVEVSKFNPIYYTNQSYYSNSVFYPSYTSTVNTTSFDVPVSVQYHLMDKGSKIRPYFGVGLMTRFNFYNINRTYTDQYNLPVNTNDKEAHSRGYIMLSQGVTWQLNSKWQLNQSVNYLFNGAANMINFRFGVGYTIK